MVFPHRQALRAWLLPFGRGAAVPGELARPLAGRLRERLAKRLVAQRDLQHPRQLLGIRGVVEVERRVAPDLGQGRGLGGHDNLAARHRLEQGKAESLVQARHDDRARAFVQELQGRLIDPAEDSAPS